MRAATSSPAPISRGGVFRSTDNGNNWEAVNDGLTVGAGINALIAVGGNIFAGAYGEGVFRSTDNGETWAQANNGLTAPFVLSFTTQRGRRSLRRDVLRRRRLPLDRRRHRAGARRTTA